MSTLQIYFFGPGQLRDHDGRSVRVRARKELAVLAYLLLEGAQSHSREVLQALFWSDLETDKGRNNLRVTLAHLQALLPTGQNGAADGAAAKLLQASRSEVQFNPAANV